MEMMIATRQPASKAGRGLIRSGTLWEDFVVNRRNGHEREQKHTKSGEGGADRYSKRRGLHHEAFQVLIGVVSSRPVLFFYMSQQLVGLPCIQHDFLGNIFRQNGRCDAGVEARLLGQGLIGDAARKNSQKKDENGRHCKREPRRASSGPDTSQLLLCVPLLLLF